MLTKNDAKVIKKILDDAIGPVKVDVSGLKQDVSGLKQDVSGLKIDVTGLKAGQSRLETKMDKGFKKLERKIHREHKLQGEILEFLEKEDRKTRSRVDKIEFHLGMVPS